MGLDITAYCFLEKIDCVFNADGEPINPKTREYIASYFKPFHNSDFPGRADDIEVGAVYSYRKSMRFRAGSYGGYNRWREELAKLVGYPLTERESHGQIMKEHAAGAWQADSGPFWELINFSDCEGIIGSATSAKLAKDFASFTSLQWSSSSKADAAANFRAAFEIASQKGAVKFS